MCFFPCGCFFDFRQTVFHHLFKIFLRENSFDRGADADELPAQSTCLHENTVGKFTACKVAVSCTCDLNAVFFSGLKSLDAELEEVFPFLPEISGADKDLIFVIPGLELQYFLFAQSGEVAAFIGRFFCARRIEKFCGNRCQGFHRDVPVVIASFKDEVFVPGDKRIGFCHCRPVAVVVSAGEVVTEDSFKASCEEAEGFKGESFRFCHPVIALIGMGERNEFWGAAFGKMIFHELFDHSGGSVGDQMAGGEIVIDCSGAVVDVGPPRFKPGEFFHKLFDVVLFAVMVVFMGGASPRYLRDENTCFAGAPAESCNIFVERHHKFAVLP